MELFLAPYLLKEGLGRDVVLRRIYLISIFVPKLLDLDIYAPCLDNKPVPALLYADDLVLLSRTKIGLKRAIKAFIAYCSEELLEINEDKSK